MVNGKGYYGGEDKKVFQKVSWKSFFPPKRLEA